MPYEPNELLSRLAGSRLATVVFLEGYLQLTFDGPHLTCDVWPTVDLGDGEIEFGEPGYRDALCSLLGEHVVATREATGEGLVIELESGSVRVHPTWDELHGPEIALLGGFDDGAWMCWRPGEESFEDLTSLES
ncbi:MAG: hypothetical protein NTV28_09820 [Propionibacteriales bacterium]|nr:hypothetical protein [Propionibacteriales bacterium]